MSRGLGRILHKLSKQKVTWTHRMCGLVCLSLFCLLPIVTYAQVCSQWKEAARAGSLKAQLQEESGIAASRRFSGRLYHINDSGDAGNFYITQMDGSDIDAVRVAGFKPEDTESLSLGPCPAKGAAENSCLYIGDIGDNDKKRKSVEVAVIDEVQNFPQPVKPRALLTFRYPDGAHDAESMAVHPDGTIYILTKENPAKLFKAPPGESSQPRLLTAVTTLNAGSAPTDMAFSDDGTRLLVLTYTDAVEFTMDFKQPQHIPLEFLQQQESVTYLPGSRSFLYSTERLIALLPQWLMRVDCAN